ncbi:hypothetical protein BJV77DRAFT_749128 [Russula vinacea]|nr:hypothetical protein BJV77DRAFT_749128 [Russula vinacea]
MGHWARSTAMGSTDNFSRKCTPPFWACCLCCLGSRASRPLRRSPTTSFSTTASAAAPPPGPPPTQPPRPRPDYGAPAGAPAGTPAGAPAGVPAGTPSWQNWGAEAMAMANNRRYVQPPPQPHGTGYGNPNRVAFANHDPYASFEDQGEVTPQAQRMIYDSIAGSRGGAPKHLTSALLGDLPRIRCIPPNIRRRARRKREHKGKAGLMAGVGSRRTPHGRSRRTSNGGRRTRNGGRRTLNGDRERSMGTRERSWDKEGYGYGQQGADWEKQQPLWISGQALAR